MDIATGDATTDCVVISDLGANTTSAVAPTGSPTSSVYWNS